MNNYKRNLLMIDLAGRVPYQVMASSFSEDGKTKSEPMIVDSIQFNKKYGFANIQLISSDLNGEITTVNTIPELCKPYLKELDEDVYTVIDVLDYYEAVDYLNENHYDYRGLIRMKLAIKITKDNNPYEKN